MRSLIFLLGVLFVAAPHAQESLADAARRKTFDQLLDLYVRNGDVYYRALKGERVKLGPVRPAADGPPLEPGAIAVSKRAVHVGTGTVPVVLGDVKGFGKKQMAAADWARGVRPLEGARFESSGG